MGFPGRTTRNSFPKMGIVCDGHFGRNTLAKVRQRFFWLGNHRVDVEKWCRYYACTAKKVSSEKGRGPLRIFNVEAELLPKSSRGNKYTLVVVGYFFKWPEVILLPNKRVTTIVAAHVREVFSRHGVPELHSDQGRSFESRRRLDQHHSLSRREDNKEFAIFAPLHHEQS